MHPSFFVPANCDLPPLSTHQVCAVMSSYTHVVTIGDSMTRHLRQGFYIALTNNFVGGGMVFPAHRRQVAPSDFYSCQCDGQFSEHHNCRTFRADFSDMYNPSEIMACSHLPYDERFRFSGQWKDRIMEKKCRNPDSRGILLSLQGGPQHNCNATFYIEDMLQPFLAQPGFQICAKRKKVHIIWTPYHAQSPILDKKYPHQSHSNAIQFNEAMAAYFREETPNLDVYTMDAFNLTKGAQTDRKSVV